MDLKKRSSSRSFGNRSLHNRYVTFSSIFHTCQQFSCSFCFFFPPELQFHQTFLYSRVLSVSLAILLTRCTFFSSFSLPLSFPSLLRKKSMPSKVGNSTQGCELARFVLANHRTFLYPRTFTHVHAMTFSLSLYLLVFLLLSTFLSLFLFSHWNVCILWFVKFIFFLKSITHQTFLSAPDIRTVNALISTVKCRTRLNKWNKHVPLYFIVISKTQSWKILI